MMYTGLQKNVVPLHPGILCFPVWPYFTFKQSLNTLDEKILSSSDVSLFSKPNSNQLSMRTCSIYACLSLLTSSCPPVKWIRCCVVCELHF